jgi:signal peptidase I
MQADNSSYAPPPASSRFRKKHLIWLALVVIALPLIYFSLSLAVVVFGFQPVRMAGQSMRPNINDGDKLFMSKQIGELRRGDIVVFLYPEDQTKSYIKRIVGMPGETIEVKNGKVYIDGNQIEEPYVAPEYASQDTMPGPVAIPPDNYFVMGDNRKNSSDSRYWGPVPRKLVYGKFWYRYAEGKSE